MHGDRVLPVKHGHSPKYALAETSHIGEGSHSTNLADDLENGYDETNVTDVKSG